MLEPAVQELKQVIEAHDGANVADRAFAGRVDELIGAFYDDIGEITVVPTRTLFDLFVIKVLYVERHGSDARVIDYLGRLLENYLYTSELFPIAHGGKLSLSYFSDLLRETQQRAQFQNLFEAYRRYGDNSLFVTGIFPRALRRRRGGTRMPRVAFVDRSYYVSTGRRCYQLASQHELAEETEQRVLLNKLAAYFEIYVETLNEVSERYIMGFDMGLIADKMLDNFNSYRRTGEERCLQNARRYAAILRVDPEAFPSLMKRLRPRGVLLDAPPSPSASA
ncbi:MAG: hypothetical protein WBD55_08235 [Dehalococcoidia bacterium]